MHASNSVLLIEDNPGDARLVIEYLAERFGDDCEVRAASTLAAGLEALRKAPVDVVLLDLSLPDSSGLETLLQVQAQAPRTPVVVLTGGGGGDDGDEQAIEALRVGAEDYLSKNHIDGVELVRSLRYAVQRRQSADKLRDSEARYRMIVETAEEGILQVDANAAIRFANARTAGMLGVASPALIGRSLLDQVAPQQRAAAAQLLAAVPGRRASAELQLLRSDGTPLWVIAAAGSIASQPDGRLDVVVMLTDITGRKLAEDELLGLKTELEARVAERTAQLQSANAELEAFSYSVAHDLRTPLNGILGFASLLQSDAANALSAPSQRYVQFIERSARGMDDLIGGLLALAQVARKDPAAQALDLSAMARAEADRLAGTAPQRQVQWLIDAGVAGFGDPTLIAVMLQNLLQNAWKYTEQASPAQIRFGLTRSASDPQRPVYFVRDNGIGFDMASAGQLFTPFHRLLSARSFAGTGIGLATVRRIIERHGGAVWAESQPGVSTTFYFTLQVPQSAPQTVPQ